MVLNELDIMKRAVNDPVYTKYLADEFDKDAAKAALEVIHEEKKSTINVTSKEVDLKDVN